MIKDPVWLETTSIYEQICRENIGNKFLALSRNKIRLSYLIGTTTKLEFGAVYIGSESLWTVDGVSYAYGAEPRRSYSFHEINIGKEIFLTKIRELYPESLEWLLYHPEWF